MSEIGVSHPPSGDGSYGATTRLLASVQFAFLLSIFFALATPIAYADEVTTGDDRQTQLRDLNGYFPFTAVESADQWPQRRAEIRRRILVSQGLWPLPTKPPLNPVIHGRVEREDYVVDRVYFESAPDHFVTGSLYRPKDHNGPLPAILSPHGHWKDGRFYDAGDDGIKKELESGAESFAVGGRYPIQARAVQLARMGCLVFVYDMTGYADSVQLAHRPDRWDHLDRPTDWGFMSVPADLRLQNMMGLQTWNSIRAIDFLLTLPETDPNRIGVTGASGGGTQSMIISAIDDRIAAAMPCVMVSTAMQGGCTCENAPLLRIGQGNIDIAAATAPRPLGLTAADDWTRELETKGYPELQQLYAMLGKPDHLTAVFHTEFPHNYNQINRLAMYSFFNRHFGLGFKEPIAERDYQPLSRQEATVWTEEHPQPSGELVGDSHEVELLRRATAGTERQMERLLSETASGLDEYRRVVGGGWKTIIGRTFDRVGKVSFAETEQEDLGLVTARKRTLVRRANGESVSMVQIDPLEEPIGTIIWAIDSARRTNMDPVVLEALKHGFTVITVDLIEQDSESQLMLSQDSPRQWQRFSGYTYGYNHCLFAQQTHDLLSVIKYAESLGHPIHLVGLGENAGPVTAAAGSQALEQVHSLVGDPAGVPFRDIDRHDHPMFVPGAVKYFGVDGLLSLNAPNRMLVIAASPQRNRLVFEPSLPSDRELVSWWLEE